MELKKIEFILVLACFFICLFLLVESFAGITGFAVRTENELRAPHDFFSEENIKIYEDKIVLEIENYTLSKYSVSGSMVPVFDSDANGVGIKPNSEQDVHVGDIITFRQNQTLIVHRVIEMGTDEEGWFCITKGDGNDFNDGKIRFNEIDSVLVAIIY